MKAWGALRALDTKNNIYKYCDDIPITTIGSKQEIIKRICHIAVEYAFFSKKWHQVLSKKSTIVTSDMDVTRRLSKHLTKKLGCHYVPEASSEDLARSSHAHPSLRQGREAVARTASARFCSIPLEKDSEAYDGRVRAPNVNAPRV